MSVFPTRRLLACVFAVAATGGMTTEGLGEATNFEQHVRPIFREHCLSCHNAQKQSGGLSLETYAALMTGGSSGEVVYAGELDSSRLWALVNHEDEPTMPPNQEKLTAAKLAVIRKWIEGGTLERADSAPRPVKRSVSLTMVPDASSDDTPGTMPSGIFRQPVTVSDDCRAPFSRWRQVRRRRYWRSVVRDKSCCFTWRNGPFWASSLFRKDSRRRCVSAATGGGWLPAAGEVGCRVSLRLYDVRDGRRVQTVGDELDSVLAADVDLVRQQIAIGGPTRLVRVFDIAQADMRFEINKHTDWVTDLEFSPNGQFLATAGRQGDLFVWESERGREYQTLAGHPAAITAVSWRADSKLLATASEDGTVRLWSTEQAKPIRSWQAHAGGVLDVDFDRQGRLVSAGRDRHLRLWDGSGKALAAFPPLSDIAVESAIAHDMQVVVAGDWQGQLKVWSVDPPTELASLVANPISLESRVSQAEEALRKARQERESRQAALQDNQARIETMRRQYEELLNQLVAATQDIETRRLSADNQSSDEDLRDAEMQLQQREREVGRLAAAFRQHEFDEESLQQAIEAAANEIEQHEQRWQAAIAEFNRFRAHVQVLRQQVGEAAAAVETMQQKLADAQLELELFEQSYPDGPGQRASTGPHDSARRSPRQPCRPRPAVGRSG